MINQVKTEKMDSSTWDFLSQSKHAEQTDGSAFSTVFDTVRNDSAAVSSAKDRGLSQHREPVESATEKASRGGDLQEANIVEDDVGIENDVQVNGAEQSRQGDDGGAEDNGQPAPEADGKDAIEAPVDDKSEVGVEDTIAVDAGADTEIANISQVVAETTAAMLGRLTEQSKAVAGQQQATQGQVVNSEPVNTVNTNTSGENVGGATLEAAAVGPATKAVAQVSGSAEAKAGQTQPVADAIAEGQAKPAEAVIQSLIGETAETAEPVETKVQAKPAYDNVEQSAANNKPLDKAVAELPMVSRPEIAAPQQSAVAETTAETASGSTRHDTAKQQTVQSSGNEANVDVLNTMTGQTEAQSNDFAKQGRGNAHEQAMLNAVSGQHTASSSTSQTTDVKASFASQMAQQSPVEMRENVENIVRMARTAHVNGQSRVQIRLQPPELGTLRIDIKQNAEGLVLRFETNNPKTQQLLQQSVNDLKAQLESQGMNNTQIDVQLRLDVRSSMNSQNTGQQDGDGSDGSADSQQSSQQQNNDQQSESQQYVWQSLDDAESQGHGGPIISDGAGHYSADSNGWSQLNFRRLDLVG